MDRKLASFCYAVYAILTFMTLCFCHSQACSCTIWAAAGDAVSGGGTLIAKNRDEAPDWNFLKLVTPERGYRYYGLWSGTGKSEGFRGGINEKGLVFVPTSTHTADSVLRSIRRTPRLGRTLLAECATVKEALARMGNVWGVAIFLLADKREIAAVEIVP